MEKERAKEAPVVGGGEKLAVVKRKRGKSPGAVKLDPIRRPFDPSVRGSTMASELEEVKLPVVEEEKKMIVEAPPYVMSDEDL
jgi:hypothetical protein